MKEYEKHDVIITRNLVLGYEGDPLISPMTISIRPNEFIGILGPNGSGKSTFLKALLGLIKPISGQLLVLDKIPYYGNTKIGYMPQMRKSIAITNLSSRSILEASCDGQKYGLPLLSPSKKQEIQKAIELVQASPYADRPFEQLSGGERQRIFLAQALLGAPSLLLLDEPLANLDPKYQEIFIDLLTNAQKKLNASILFTAHDPNPLLPVMDRVLFFGRGKAAIGKTNEIITSKKLSDLYETDIEVIQLKNKLFVLSETQPNVLGQTIDHHD
jgi:zinc/manganese transport system ATP-binding protein